VRLVWRLRPILSIAKSAKRDKLSRLTRVQDGSPHDESDHEASAVKDGFISVASRKPHKVGSLVGRDLGFAAQGLKVHCSIP
jgi:hypothetical protein